MEATYARVPAACPQATPGVRLTVQNTEILGVSADRCIAEQWWDIALPTVVSEPESMRAYLRLPEDLARGVR